MLLESNITSIFPQWVEDINTGLSLIGFFITFYVMYEVRIIRNRFLIKARLPELIKKLKMSGSELNKYLGDTHNWDSNKNKVLGEVKISCVLLKSSSKIIPSPEKRQIVDTYKKLNKICTGGFSNATNLELQKGWDIYSDIQSIIVILEQLSLNLKWE